MMQWNGAGTVEGQQDAARRSFLLSSLLLRSVKEREKDKKN